MRFESQHGRWQAKPPGLLDQVLEHGAMAQVQSIEIADG
jgi:hypothetical protein